MWSASVGLWVCARPAGLRLDEEWRGREGCRSMLSDQQCHSLLRKYSLTYMRTKPRRVWVTHKRADVHASQISGAHGVCVCVSAV